MKNFCSTLALVAITAQALQLDDDGTSGLEQLLPDATEAPAISLAQVDTGGEAGLLAGTYNVDTDIDALQSTV